MTTLTGVSVPAQGAGWFVWGTAADGTIRTLETLFTLAGVIAGSVFRCPWNGTAWTYAGTALSARPSSRTDIFFELTGAPAATADPAWMINGDSRIDL